MNKTKVLIVEDIPTDAELARREIDKELGVCDYRIVEREKDFIEALDRFAPDLVISDYMLPRFDGMRALKIAVDKRPEVPFIVFTGSMNEDTAVACMKAGAWDYVIKEHIKRLGPAVAASLKEKESRLEKKRAEEALYRSGKEWRATFDAMNDMVFVTDTEGIVLRANTAFQQFAAKQWSEIIGERCHALLWKNADKQKSCPLMRSLKTGKREESEVAIQDAWYRSVVDPIVDKDGRIIEVVHILTDISVSKEMETSLRKSEEKHRRLFETMAQGAVYQDAEGNIFSANPAAERILGLTLDQMQGRTSTDPRWRAVREDGSDFPGEEHPAMIALRTGKPVDNTVMGVFNPCNETYTWININAVPLFREQEEKPYQVYTTFEDITERTRAMEAVKNSEAKLNTIFENIPIIMMVVDKERRVREINTVGIKTAGLSPEQAFGLRQGEALRCLHALDVPAGCGYGHDCRFCTLRNTVLDTIENRRAHDNVEADMVLSTDGAGSRTSGGKRTFLIHTAPLDVDDEELVLIIMDDITEIKHARKELETTVAELRITESRLQQHTEWMHALNSLTREIARKNTMESILRVAMGYLEKSFIFLFAWILFENKDGQTYTVKAVSSRGRKTSELIGITEGSEIPLREIMTSLGFAESTTGRSLDVGELKAQASTEQAREDMNALLSHSVSNLVFVPMVVERDRTGAVLMANDTQVELSEDEWNFLHDMAEYLALSAQNWSLYRELEASYEELARARKTIMDQERLRAIGQIASGIAHDINNTLVPITLYTEALLDTEPNLSDRAGRYLKTIRKSIGDIERVVSRLRAFYRRGNEQVREAIPIGVLFSDVIDLTRPKWKDMANKQGTVIECVQNVPETLPKFFGDKSEIRESLINLILNAVDAMPEGGRINLKAYEQEKTIVLEVTDTGKGMTEDEQRQCIEPFFTTKGVKGSGLGLAAVYGMVQRHNGELDITSTPGEGTSVRLVFPLGEKAEEKPSVTIRAQIHQSLRVLLIDDDERVRTVLEEMLKLDGHTVLSRASGEEGLELFKREVGADGNIDLVITDLGMPGMDGNEVGKSIKQISPETPVILLTGWGNLMEEEQPEHIDRLLSKPPAMEQLRSVIWECVNEKSGKD